MVIRSEYHWAKGALGTVSAPPDFLISMAQGWDGHVRTIQGRTQTLYFLWVVLDTPQNDADGDGPYSAAEIDTRFLEAVSSADPL